MSEYFFNKNPLWYACASLIVFLVVMIAVVIVDGVNAVKKIKGDRMKNNNIVEKETFLETDVAPDICLYANEYVHFGVNDAFVEIRKSKDDLVAEFKIAGDKAIVVGPQLNVALSETVVRVNIFNGFLRLRAKLNEGDRFIARAIQ